MREPAAPVTAEDNIDLEEEGPPPKLALPPSFHIGHKT